MKLSRLTWAGITLIAVAAIALGGWAAWLPVPINKPIDMPIATAAGHIRTPTFKVNVSRLYTIELVTKKTIPFDTLNCLLGMSNDPFKKCARPSVVKAAWVVTSGRDIVAQGTSDGDQGGAWAQDDIARELGSFRSKSGHSYQVDVDFVTDAAALSPTDPHLKVEVSTDYYEGDMWISFFLTPLCGAIAFIGVLLLVTSAIRLSLRRKTPTSI
jgi:hypothetical protein